MLRGSCLVLTAVLLGFGWFPFNFWPRNDLRWAPGGRGLHFGETAILVSERDLLTGAPPVRSPEVLPAELTVEILVQPDAEPASGVPLIVALFNGRVPENLGLGQWRTSILLRTPSDDPRQGRALRETGVRDALVRDQRRQVTLVCDADGTRFYLDGVPLRHHPGFRLSPDLLAGRLLVGNSAHESRTWQGTIFGLAFHRRALGADEVRRRHKAWANADLGSLTNGVGLAACYAFDEGAGGVVHDRSPATNHLHAPTPFRVLRKPVLGPPGSGYPPRPHPWRDVVINVLGFIPFGFVLAMHGSQRRPGGALGSVLPAVLVGMGVSLIIELAQVLLPSRDSSLPDLITNSLGTLVGALIWLVIWRRGRSSENRAAQG